MLFLFSGDCVLPSARRCRHPSYLHYAITGEESAAVIEDILRHRILLRYQAKKDAKAYSKPPKRQLVLDENTIIDLFVDSDEEL